MLRSQALFTEMYVNTIAIWYARDSEVLHESVLELLREPINYTIWVVAKNHHLPRVRVGHGVALETVLVPALLVAHLAVPSQFLQALGLQNQIRMPIQRCPLRPTHILSKPHIPFSCVTKSHNLADL